MLCRPAKDNSPESAVQSLCWLFTVEGTELVQAPSGGNLVLACVQLRSVQ